MSNYLQHLPSEILDIILEYYRIDAPNFTKFRTLSLHCKHHIDDITKLWNQIDTITLRSPYTHSNYHDYKIRWQPRILLPFGVKYEDQRKLFDKSDASSLVVVMYNTTATDPNNRYEGKIIKESFYHNLYAFNQRWKRRFFYERIFFHPILSYSRIILSSVILVMSLFFLYLFIQQLILNNEKDPQFSLNDPLFTPPKEIDKEHMLNKGIILKWICLLLYSSIRFFHLRNAKIDESYAEDYSVFLCALFHFPFSHFYPIFTISKVMNVYLLQHLGWDGFLCFHGFLDSLFTACFYRFSGWTGTSQRKDLPVKKQNLILCFIDCNLNLLTDRGQASSNIDIFFGIFSHFGIAIIEFLELIYVGVLLYYFTENICLYISHSPMNLFWTINFH